MNKKEFNLKPRNECMFDEVSLGEVMLRFDPGESRIKTARSFRVWEGGGEYNVARALRKCFKLRTGIITAFVDNEIGRLLEDLIMQGGVDTSFIKWVEHDGIGKSYRNGLNFTERGYGIRRAVGVSDRANTAISKMKASDFDFEYIFGKLGVRWLHTGGIYAALSDETAKTILEAIKVAKKYGTIVSYDLNYRASLWQNNGGIEKAQQLNKKIAQYVDVILGNEKDFLMCLGIGNEDINNKFNIETYRDIIEQIVKTYDNLKVVATSLREVNTATSNNWTGLCWKDGKIYKAKKYDNLEVLDRVGSGDGFASGLIYGLMTSENPQTAVDLGTAHGALIMTTPGDTSMASLEEVENVVKGATMRIKR